MSLQFAFVGTHVPKGVKDTSRLNPDISLGELGIDSLMSVEVKQTLELDYDVTLCMLEIRTTHRRLDSADR
ncbi:hypothetical protein MTO96_041203 [Rhipicephalus appendiculatus]